VLLKERFIYHFSLFKNKMQKKKIRNFTVVIKRDEDGLYVGYVPSIKGCHTQGKNLDELMSNIKEAIELCLEVKKEETDNEFVGIQTVEVSL
jgi:predicted RNase H-like HicB family nuclease